MPALWASGALPEMYPGAGQWEMAGVFWYIPDFKCSLSNTWTTTGPMMLRSELAQFHLMLQRPLRWHKKYRSYGIRRFEVDVGLRFEGFSAECCWARRNGEFDSDFTGL